MSETENAQRASTPWHLWVVGMIALLWNSMGALDYFMTQTQNEAYMANFTAAQLEFFYGLPSWVVAAWAIAVWGGVLGAMLLLTRKSLAVWVFLGSLIGMVLSTIHNYLLSNGMEVMGDTFSLVFTAVIFVIALALFLYSNSMKKRGVLI